MEVLQDTYKETKIGRIPKDWNVLRLSELGKFYRGHTYSAKNVQSNGLLVLRSTNIQKGELVLHKDLVFVDKECKEDILLRNGDLVLCMANGSKRLVGKSAKYFGEDSKDITIGAFCSIYRSNNVLINYVFESYLYHKYLQITLAGSTINNLKNSELEKFAFPFPNDIAEQQKIAAILSTLDEQISTTDKIIEKSKELKKGLMQKLFSEGIQHTEFKDSKIGRIPKDWEVLRLGEVCLKIRDGNYGGSYPKANEFLNSGVPFLTSASIGGGNFIIKKKIKFISPEKHSELTKAHIKFGDVLFTNRGANVGSVALVKQELDDANIGPQLTYLRCKLDVIDNQYLFNLMQSNSFQKQVKSLDNGTAMNFFGIGTTKTFKLPIPQIQEQQKIAAILSEADAKIEKEQTQKTQLEQLKKGLMQQLLTGKKRVKV
jgi:type I restriction enzyme, S subunit